MTLRWWDNVMAGLTNQQTTSKSKMPAPGKKTAWQEEALEQQQMQIAQLGQNQAYITWQASQMQSYMEAQENFGWQYHPGNFEAAHAGLIRILLCRRIRSNNDPPLQEDP